MTVNNGRVNWGQSAEEEYAKNMKITVTENVLFQDSWIKIKSGVGNSSSCSP